MYAPKLQTWLTNWDRFDMMLDYRIEQSAKVALNEIADLSAKAMAEFAPPVREAQGETQAKLFMRMAQHSANPYYAGIPDLHRSQQSFLTNLGLGAILGQLYPT